MVQAYPYQQNAVDWTPRRRQPRSHVQTQLRPRRLFNRYVRQLGQRRSHHRAQPFRRRTQSLFPCFPSHLIQSLRPVPPTQRALKHAVGKSLANVQLRAASFLVAPGQHHPIREPHTGYLCDENPGYDKDRFCHRLHAAQFETLFAAPLCSPLRRHARGSLHQKATPDRLQRRSLPRGIYLSTAYQIPLWEESTRNGNPQPSSAP